MSNASESDTSTKLGNKPRSLITVIGDAEATDEPSNTPASSSATSNSNGGGTKRTFLEVNNVEKYKSFLIKPLETKRVKPSDTLDRVRQFLPMLKESTNKLLDEFKADPDRVNIENVDEEAEQHIEMNLALVPDSNTDDSDEDEDEEDDDEDEAKSSHQNKLSKYLSLLKEGGDEDEDEDDGDDDEESSEEDSDKETTGSESNPLDALGLGFKVTNPDEIRKLKTSVSDALNGSGQKKSRPLIKVIESDEPNKNEQNTDETEKETVSSVNITADSNVQ